MINIYLQPDIIHYPQHVLRQFLHSPKQTDYNLRSRGHGLILPEKLSGHIRKNNVCDDLQYTFLANVVIHVKSIHHYHKSFNKVIKRN